MYTNVFSSFGAVDEQGSEETATWLQDESIQSIPKGRHNHQFAIHNSSPQPSSCIPKIY
jgi:hypothetical protein